jgi:hypothetical protein
MAFKFSIGIVTYLGRFESYFQPLVRKLHFLFPDYEKNVFINGHYDTVRQFQYLRDVTAFLGHYPDFRYVTNLHHQPLARGWNWLMLMSRCNQVLILNDDISFDLEFRHNLESLRLVDQVFMLNHSWSHFVINKQVIRRVGWFDERFIGVGYEDIDYVLRLGMNGVPLGNAMIHGLHNHSALQDNAGWANLSGVFQGKYASMNEEVFLKKWFRSDFGPVPQKGSFTVRYDVAEWTVALNEALEAMPEYYPLDCLDSPDKQWQTRKRPLGALIAKTCSFSHSLYWRLRLTAGGWLRRCFGPQWEQWMVKMGRRG